MPFDPAQFENRPIELADPPSHGLTVVVGTPFAATYGKGIPVQSRFLNVSITGNYTLTMIGDGYTSESVTVYLLAGYPQGFRCTAVTAVPSGAVVVALW